MHSGFKQASERQEGICGFYNPNNKLAQIKSFHANTEMIEKYEGDKLIDPDKKILLRLRTFGGTMASFRIQHNSENGETHRGLPSNATCIVEVKNN